MVVKEFCLNIWGGKLHEPLLRLIEDHAPTTDVFCFQEVFSSSLSTKIIDGKYVSIFETLQVLLSRHGFRVSFSRVRLIPGARNLRGVHGALYLPYRVALLY